MIYGVGTDILDIKRIRTLVDRDINDPFILKTYTEKEIETALKRPDPAMFFSTRFAGKEAVFKSLKITVDGLRLNDIEILEGEAGIPYLVLHGKIKETAREKGVSHIDVSLSYERDYALAFAVAIKSQSLSK